MFSKISSGPESSRNHSVPFFQPKLTVNTPGDAHEREADTVADQVMRMREGDAPIVQRMPLTPVGNVQRKCAGCEEKEKEGVQRKETGGGDASGKAAPSVVSDVLSSGSGQPMESGTRQFMESRFGQDFSQVRIHTDERAAESASAIQARAYTSGRDVVFGSGEYQPGSESGRRLLAHELVHVGQQKKISTHLQRSVKEKKPCAVHAYDNSKPKDSTIPTDGSGLGVSSVSDMVVKVNKYVDTAENNCSCVNRLEINGHGDDGYQSVGNANVWSNDDKALVYNSKDEHLNKLKSLKLCSSGLFMLLGCHVGRGTKKGEVLLSKISKILPGFLVGGAQHYTHGPGLGKKKVVGEGDEVNADFTVKDTSKSSPFLGSPYVTWFLTINGKEYKILGKDSNTADSTAKMKQAEKIKVKTPDGIHQIK